MEKNNILLKRNQEIINFRKLGYTYANIGEKYDITGERVRQIINNYTSSISKIQRNENEKIRNGKRKVNASNLKMIRVKKGIKAKDVVEKIGKSPAWLCRVEKGEIFLGEEMYNKFLDLYKVKDLDGFSMQDLKEENKVLRELLQLYMCRDEIG